MSTATGVILRPDYGARSHLAGRSLIRAAVVAVMAQATKSYASDLLKQHYQRDADVGLILKAASTPASMSSTEWAGMLVNTSVAEFVGTLGPSSAGAELLSRGLSFSFDHMGYIAIGNLIADAAIATFTAPGSPIPARQFSVDGNLLIRKELKAIATFTRETFQHSIPTIELLMRTALSDSFALAVDLELLSTTASDAVRPGGLRAGIVAAGESADPDPHVAMLADVATLIKAVAVVAGNAPIMLVCAAGQAAALRLWGDNNMSYEVFASSGLADGEVVAICSNGLISAIDPMPRFEVSDTGSLQLDSAPVQIGVAGSPTVVAAKTVEIFQSDLLALKAVFQCSWGLRSASAIAWIENAGWG